MGEAYDYDGGVRLGVYLADDPSIGVALWCSCGFVQKFAMADVIARLDARGIDGRNVGVRELPKFLTRTCPKCSGTSFEARPNFAPVVTGLRRGG